MMQKMFAVFLALTLLLSGCAAEQAPVGQAPSPDALAVEAASALHISPEMLGYILAKLNAYTDNITFSGNGVSLRIM